MTRTYSIPSHISVMEALNLVESVLEPFGGYVNVLPGELLLVIAEPIVFEVCDGAIRFELHEIKGCTCVACRCRSEVMA